MQWNDIQKQGKEMMKNGDARYTLRRDMSYLANTKNVSLNACSRTNEEEMINWMK